MKKVISLLSLLIALVFLASCGGSSSKPTSLSNSHGQPAGGGTKGNVLSFNLDSSNPDNTIAPFPNDLIFATVFGGSKSISRQIESAPSEDEVLMAAIKKLGIDGFSPNSPIVIPMSSKVQLDENELNSSVKVVDLDKLVTYGIIGVNPSDNNTYIQDYLLESGAVSNPNDYCVLFSQNQDNDTLAQACFGSIANYFCKPNPTSTCLDIVSGAETGGTIRITAGSTTIDIPSPSVFAKVYVDQTNIENRITNNYSGNFNGAIVAYPLKPLNPGDTYAVAITNNINNLSFDNTLYDWLMNKVNQLPDSVKNQMTQADYDKLSYLRGQYANVENALSLLGFDKDNMLMMFTFTTADKTLSLFDYPEIQAALEGKVPLDELTLTGYDYDNMAIYKNGSLNGNNEFVKNIDPLSDLPLTCQILHNQNASLPEITDDLKSWMLTPNVYALDKISNALYNFNPDNVSSVILACKTIFGTPGLYDNVTVTQANDNAMGGILIFQHGLWGSKDEINYADPNTGKSIVDSFKNFHIYAMDLPWHGGRVCKNGVAPCAAMPAPVPVNSSGQPLCDPSKSGHCYLTTNPIYDVLNIYQSLLDMHTFAKFVAFYDYETALYEISKGLQPTLINISYLSQSMGSINGSMLINLDSLTQSAFFNTFYNTPVPNGGGITYGQLLEKFNIPTKINNFISKADLNVGGANYASIVNEALFPGIAGMLPPAPFIKYYITLDMFQWLLDPVDPAYLASNPSLKGKLILQNAYHDTLVPNISNTILANGYGYNPETFTPVTPNSTAQAKAGWYMFEGEEPYSWINHGFIIHTTIDGYSQEAQQHFYLPYIEDAQSKARAQAACFFGDNSSCPVQ